MPLLLHQQFDYHLLGNSTAPRGVRVISVIFAILSIAALAIFVISIWRNIDGPPLIVKIGRLTLPLIVLAGAYMIRRLWRSGFWIFGTGVLLWFLVLTRSLVIADNGVAAFVVVGALWCFSLGTLIYLVVERDIFKTPSLLPMVPQSTLPEETRPAPLQTLAQNNERKKDETVNEILPRAQ